MALATGVLVIGIRESATINAVLVITKVGVVIFVMIVGIAFINSSNWTKVPVTERLMPEEVLIPDKAEDIVKEQIKEGKISKEERKERIKRLTTQALAEYKVETKSKEEAPAAAASFRPSKALATHFSRPYISGDQWWSMPTRSSQSTLNLRASG